MIKVVITTISILFLATIIQTSNLYRYQSKRTLPSEYVDAELVNTPRQMILKLRSLDQVQLLTVPDVYQFYNYSSGHSCLEAIFHYYQFPTDAVRYRETMFISPDDFDQNNFTTPEKLIIAANRMLDKETLPDRKNVFRLQIKENLTVRQLQDLLQRGIPPILLITKGKTAKTGSYVIVVGHDQNNYYVQDPNKMGSIAYLPKEELEPHWQNTYGGKQAKSLAIIIQFKDGHRPQEYPLVRPSP